MDRRGMSQCKSSPGAEGRCKDSKEQCPDVHTGQRGPAHQAGVHGAGLPWLQQKAKPRAVTAQGWRQERKKPSC